MSVDQVGHALGGLGADRPHNSNNSIPTPSVDDILQDMCHGLLSNVTPAISDDGFQLVPGQQGRVVVDLLHCKESTRNDGVPGIVPWLENEIRKRGDEEDAQSGDGLRVAVSCEGCRPCQ